MKMLTSTLLCFTMLVACASDVHTFAAAGELTVNLQVQTGDDDPIAGYPLAIYCYDETGRPTLVDWGRTENNGSLQLSGEFDSSCSVMFLRLHQEHAFEATQVMKPLFGSWTSPLMRSQYQYRIEPEDTDAPISIVLTCQPAMKLNVEVKRPKNLPSPAGLLTRTRAGYSAITDVAGRGSIPGVKLGLNEVFAVLDVPYVTHSPVLMLDGDEATVRIPAPSVGELVPFDGTVTNLRPWVIKSLIEGWDMGGLGMVLISDDGQTIFWYLSVRDKVLGYPEDQLPRAAPGRYYAVPGSFLATELQLAVIDACRLGINLKPYDIPSIEITADVVAEIDFDAIEAMEAIQRLMKDLPADSLAQIKAKQDAAKLDDPAEKLPAAGAAPATQPELVPEP